MKKFFFLPLVVAVAGMLFCTACKKKTFERTGKFVYLSESYKHPYAKYEIKAIFFSDNKNELPFCISQNIPIKYKNTDTLFVKIDLVEIYPTDKGMLLVGDNVPVYKIKNIKEF